jgi:hypothetical protein
MNKEEFIKQVKDFEIKFNRRPFSDLALDVMFEMIEDNVKNNVADLEELTPETCPDMSEKEYMESLNNNTQLENELLLSWQEWISLEECWKMNLQLPQDNVSITVLESLADEYFNIFQLKNGNILLWNL